MNSINLIGNICNEVELKRTSSGKDVAIFRIAVKRPYSRETTDFFTVVAWGKKSELVSKYMGKGSRIGISGVLTSRNYQDKDGNNRTAFEVVADQVYFAEGRRSIQPEVSSNLIKESFPADLSDFEELDDDCPF